MKRTEAGKIALGGVLAALAAVIMSIGGLIPVNTYACPVLCTVLCYIVLRFCGRRIAWAWYAVVCILSLLLGPDKEAAAVYVFFGYYPMLKSLFDRCKFRVLWKLLYFNGSAAVLYGLLIWVVGMTRLAQEYLELGVLGLAVMLILGNASFIMLDILLTRLMRKK